MPSSPDGRARKPRTELQQRAVAKAHAANLRQAADRAVDDPATLARAARIVRAAIARRVLTPEDLQGDIVKPSEFARTADGAT